MSLTTAVAAASADQSAEGRKVIQALQGLRRISGQKSEFWPQYVQAAADLCRASLAFIICRSDATANWRILASCGGDDLDLAGQDGQERLLAGGDPLFSRALVNGFAYEPMRIAVPGMRRPMMLATCLEADGGQFLLVTCLDPATQQQISEVTVRTLLIADIPSSPATSRMTIGPLSDVLDILLQIFQKDRFYLAAMTAVNAVATRFNCSRASLGWKSGDYVHARAISHTERFERKTDAVQDLEAVHEEAFEQDEEILWPRDEGSGIITVAHRQFSQNYAASDILTLPLRLDDKVVGVLCCERTGKAFDDTEARVLRLLASLIVPWLADRQHRDRWFGARLAATAQKAMTRLFKSEKVFVKLVSGAAAACLLYILFGTWTYRVEGTFKLSTDEVALLTAPFDGYVKEVSFSRGDLVEANQALLTLDTREMLMQEAEIIAELHRASREAEKARARNELAEMRIADAQVEQSRTQLERVKFYLDQAMIRAPFAGVIVEGDAQKLAGLPVSKGDVMVRIAQTGNLFVEILVDERDIDEVDVGARGELALLSRPDMKISFVIDTILPVAEVKETTGNVFLVRARFVEPPRPWWRPGMSGIAKISIEDRRIAWILLHRTFDFLRVRFWW